MKKNEIKIDGGEYLYKKNSHSQLWRNKIQPKENGSWWEVSERESLNLPQALLFYLISFDSSLVLVVLLDIFLILRGVADCYLIGAVCVGLSPILLTNQTPVIGLADLLMN